MKYNQVPVIIYTNSIILESLKLIYVKDYDFAFYVPPESKARAFNVFVTWKDFLPPRCICAVLLRFAACLGVSVAASLSACLGVGVAVAVAASLTLCLGVAGAS
jgi:hypothetical protein